VAAHQIGKQRTWGLIDRSGACSSDLRWELTARFEDSRLASISSDGLVEHCGAANAVLSAGALHSSTFELNLCRFCHRRTDATQRIPRRVLTVS
jgi:hypothetical protein